MEDPSLKKIVQNSNEHRYIENISEDLYQSLIKKIYLQSEFLFKKIPPSFVKSFVEASYDFLTKKRSDSIRSWPNSLFVEGSKQLKFPMHLVVFCPYGKEAFSHCFSRLSFCLRGAGLPEAGLASTFLGSEKDIHYYLNNKPIEKILSMDLKIPIQRVTKEKESLEFLSHQKKDVRDYSLFVVYDNPTGNTTALISQYFPHHPLFTYIPHESQSSNYETLMAKASKALPPQLASCKSKIFSLPNLSGFYQGALKNHAPLFAQIALCCQLAPRYTGKNWGVEGGPEGILKVLTARYGSKMMYSHDEITHALRWAEKNKSQRF